MRLWKFSRLLWDKQINLSKAAAKLFIFGNTCLSVIQIVNIRSVKVFANIIVMHISVYLYVTTVTYQWCTTITQTSTVTFQVKYYWIWFYHLK
jgi:hypothetical protein